ncbi:MAG: N-acetyl-gamma-glutamyl-phosphate reductase [Planctomycetota bacterium]
MDVRAAIIGPTGYTGYHLVELLLRHPRAELTYLGSHRETLPDLRDEFPKLAGRLPDEVAQCRPIDVEAIAAAADVAFLALPHRAAMAVVPGLLDAGVRVIDLSADYRISDADLYESVYQVEHTDRANLKDAVYGLPELFRADLPGAMLVANPGCYPTASALAVAPLLSHSLIKPDPVTINAASGVSGAGRKATAASHFPEMWGSYRAYGSIGGHRHQPEIGQTLTRVAGHPITPLFVPHLLPIEVGILATVYLEPHDPEVTQAELEEAFEDAYREEPFVRFKPMADGGLPDTRYVSGTNYVDLAVRLVAVGESQRIVVFAAEDNLIKGASGQAVQNMNAVFEMDETLGLR